MSCLFWYSECHYRDKSIPIPKEIKDVLDLFGRTQMMGNNFVHIPFHICRDCMKYCADDYARHSEEYSVVLSHSYEFEEMIKIAETVLEKYGDKNELIKHMKQAREDYNKKSRELSMIHRAMEMGELALKLILEKEKEMK